MNWQEHDTAKSHFVQSSEEAGLELHIRSHGEQSGNPPVLMVHGATYASRLYDIPLPDMSWLKTMEKAGFSAYALDVRGYGKSRSTIMETYEKPYATAQQAIRDISDVVSWITERHPDKPLQMVGGSWGSITSALYASTIGCEKVKRLVLYAPIYNTPNAGWAKNLASPTNPETFNPSFGAWRPMDQPQTEERWKEEVPPGAHWFDEEVLTALVQSSLADNPVNKSENPGAFKVPNGTYVDLWQVFGLGRPLYKPENIKCPTLLLRGSGDQTSTRCDALKLFDALGTRDKHYTEIADGGHFISAERRAQEIFAVSNQFLSQPIN